MDGGIKSRGINAPSFLGQFGYIMDILYVLCDNMSIKTTGKIFFAIDYIH